MDSTDFYAYTRGLRAPTEAPIIAASKLSKEPKMNDQAALALLAAISRT